MCFIGFALVFTNVQECPFMCYQFSWMLLYVCWSLFIVNYWPLIFHLFSLSWNSIGVHRVSLICIDYNRRLLIIPIICNGWASTIFKNKANTLYLLKTFIITKVLQWLSIKHILSTANNLYVCKLPITTKVL